MLCVYRIDIDLYMYSEFFNVMTKKAEDICVQCLL